MPATGMIPMFIPTFSNTENIEQREDPRAEEAPERVLGRLGGSDHPPGQDAVEHEQDAGADEPELLPHRREDEVGLLLGDVGQVGLGPLEQTPAEDAAVGDRRLGLVDVVRDVLAGAVGGDEAGEPLDLVVLDQARG